VSSQADKFIINVSSVEGEFYHKKTTAHPHTNMAKVTQLVAHGFSLAAVAAEAYNHPFLSALLAGKPQHDDAHGCRLLRARPDLDERR
jgi:hypothetical protein